MSQTPALSYWNEVLNHNYWARDRQLEVCASIPPERFVLCPAEGAGSLRDTLAHLLAVEWLWLERWRGRSPGSLLAASGFPTVAALAERWRVVEEEMREYVSSLDEEELARPLNYVNLKGNACTYALWRMMLHVFNHQNYHRGQVTLLLRLLGVQPPPVDFLVGYDQAGTSWSVRG